MISTCICNDLGSLYVLQDDWNATCVLISICICNDLGSFYVPQDDWNASFVLISTCICKDLGSLYVLQDDWNATFVLISTCICNDLGSFYVLQDDWNAAFVLIFLAGCCLAKGGCGSALEAERLASRYCKHMAAQNDTQNDTQGWATFDVGCHSWPNTVLGAFGVCGKGEFCRTNITILLCFPLYLRR